ncbi:hypothetical protein F8M41_022825 [Gigaspora margarita]|uniref:GATA-type domain-containing protein n=1 Tax=Gigaspora margarita TaxID=4874 RepID=A0A8H4ETL6_GIGMA|nr:hypothetical protein F8M41_022825 [Gigaspora margarita]
MKALGVATGTDIGTRGNRPGGKRAANVAQGVASNRATSISKPGRQVRKQRRGEARKQFAPDGSLIHNDPFTLIPQQPPFGETPLLTVISSKTQRQARFEDYGPFATLGQGVNNLESQQKEKQLFSEPCNYNPAGKCANCQTTDTPGWRAGETPDQKLCNACGLYYAKNRSHRPSNLWNTR